MCDIIVTLIAIELMLTESYRFSPITKKITQATVLAVELIGVLQYPLI